MKNIIKRSLIFIMAFCLFFTGTMPVFAQTTYTESSFPFTLNVNQEFGDDFVGEFFKDDRKLYISHESILKLGNVEERDYGFRKVDNSMYKVKESDILVLGDKKYYPFEDVMTFLSFSSRYFPDTDTLSLIWSNNIWNIPIESRNFIEDKAYSLYGWDGLDYMNVEYNAEDLLALTISNNLVTPIKKLQEWKLANNSYDRYRTALWNIMLPKNNVDTRIDVYMGIHEGAKDREPALDLIKTDKMKYLEKAFDSFKLAVTTLDIMSLDDFQSNMEFYYNIANMNTNIANGIKFICNSDYDVNDNFDKALNDTINLYNKEVSPFDLYLKEVVKSGGDFLIDTVQDTARDIVDFKDFSKAADKWLTGQNKKDFQETTDPLEIGSANIDIMKVAEWEYKLQYAKFLKSTDTEEKIKYLQNMRDIMVVYLSASNNIWQAFDGMEEYDEAYSMVITTNADLKRLNTYSYLDFNILENANETRKDILADVQFRNFTIYNISWSEEEANNVGGIDVILDGYDKDGNGFTYEHNFSHYYYLNNGLSAGFIRTGGNESQGRSVQVYDFDGYCEIVIKAKDINKSIENINISIESTDGYYDAEALAGYLVEEAGYSVYRIPLPIGAATVVKPTPTPEPTATPEPEVANNQYILDGNVADYIITFDSEIFKLSDYTYGKGIKVTLPDSIKDNIMYESYNLVLESGYKSANEYIEHMKEVYPLEYREGDEIKTLSYSQPVVIDLGNGVTYTYIDFECISIKEPDGESFINRYGCVDFGTGECLSCFEFTSMDAAGELGVSFEEYIGKLFINIEKLN